MKKIIHKLCAFFIPFLLVTSMANAAPGDQGGLPTGRNPMPDFNMSDLVKSSIKGMFDRSCGGYCIVAVCAHLRTSFSLRHGLRIWTIISPKIEHSNADLLVMSYNHVGNEPWAEWRNTFGRGMALINQGAVAPILGTPFGLNGGRADPIAQDSHQSVSYKEVDIIGHPAAILPYILDARGRIRNIRFGYAVPTIGGFPDTADAQRADQQNPNDEWSLQSMLDTGMARILETIQAQIRAYLMAFELFQIIETIANMVDTIREVVQFYNTAMTAVEAFTRGSVYGNFINPRFEANRLFCPPEVKPLQPYYLSFADAFFWRSGFPITDGPISGSNHTLQVMNPFSNPMLGSGLENWGNLYPRDGTVDQSHDSKTASVLAWRALHVLQNDVRVGRGGHRVGVPLPNGYANKQKYWQMIYPEMKSCVRQPYYRDNSITLDFMEPNEFGGYAWNIYTQYSCCMNTSGRKLGEIRLPTRLCLSLSI